ncbi:MAG: type II secretion system protein GspJ [Deltaproteobacteria bacterium]|nr:type II secretion system protein GspJ [Deltaproteobacteria bacterium]
MISSRILQKFKSSRGFTLIEVLVAVGLISVIMVLIWQATGQTLKAKQRIEKRNEVYHNARVSVDKMVQDISMAFLLSGPSQLGQRQGSPQLKTVFKGEEDSLFFDSLSHLRLFQESKESDSAEVGYKLENDPDGRDTKMLMRRESKWIDDKPEEGGVWFPLSYGVKNLKLEYYDAKKGEWQSSWNTDSDTGPKLPRAVKIKIAFENPDNKDEDVMITTVAWIEMYKNAIDF